MVVRTFLINVVAELTELQVENSQKINCRDVTSIWEGRVDVVKVDRIGNLIKYIYLG